jgi:trehalose synthase
VTVLHEVPIPLRPIERYVPILGGERMRRLQAARRVAVDSMAGHTIWNLTADATVTGVAELLRSALPYVAAAGVTNRWWTFDADPDFFRIMRRVRHGLEGSNGDGGPLCDADRRHCDAVLAPVAGELARLVRPGDVVALHHTDAAPLAEAMRAAGAVVVSHLYVGTDRHDEAVERSWSFLRPSLEAANAVVFATPVAAPEWIGPDRSAVIAPMLDVFSPKNQHLDAATQTAILVRAGLMNADVASAPVFERLDGTPAVVEHTAAVVRPEEPVPSDARLVVQVSHWDRVKDMIGVLRAFAAFVDDANAHLVLAGPEPDGFMLHPESREVFAECVDAWSGLRADARRRVHLACLPTNDTDENSVIVNALQRRADVVVQKSLAQGFSTAVAEAMLKARPIVASATGGMRGQITDRRHGLLVNDPTDPAAFAASVSELLTNPSLADELRTNAHARARDEYLLDRYFVRYVALLAQFVQP